MSGSESAGAGRARRAPAPKIIHVDAELVVVDKPADLLSVPGRSADPSVIELLRESPSLSDNPACRVVHRLDRDASGVLVLARTLAAQQSLVRQFAHRDVEKTYLALVSGYVPEDGEVNLPLTIDVRRQIARVAGARGKPSCTRYHIAQRLAGHTLLECQPITGRMHQIRAHLAAIGFPLAVDPLYGGGQAVLLSSFKSGYRPSRKHDERPLIDRLTLHALRITFAHPATGERTTFEAAPPKDLRATISQLGRLV